MKKQVLIVLAALTILLVGYAGVASLDRRFDEIKIESEEISGREVQRETGAILLSNSPVQNDTEVVECPQTEIKEGDVAETAQLPLDGDEEIRLGGVNFITSLGSGLEEVKLNSRLVFVYFRSESCGWCKKFEAEVLTDQRVMSVLEDSYVSVSIEVNRQKDVTTDYKVRGTPTLIFLDDELKEIERIPGYVDAETFVTILNKIKSN
ncbi:MAG: thioredoxin fold domain-containing protein [Candidatus Hydrothermarchaeales archaeon]